LREGRKSLATDREMKLEGLEDVTDSAKTFEESRTCVANSYIPVLARKSKSERAA